MEEMHSILCRDKYNIVRREGKSLCAFYHTLFVVLIKGTIPATFFSNCMMKETSFCCQTMPLLTQNLLTGLNFFFVQGLNYLKIYFNMFLIKK